jgi:hypothetical protein
MLASISVDEIVAQALMVAFAMVVDEELGQRATKMLLSKESADRGIPL